MNQAYKKELQAQIELLINEAMEEDCVKDDITSQITIPSNHKSSAKIIIQEPGILAGIDIARQVFKMIDPGLKFQTFKKDGDYVEPNTIVAIIKGKTRSILKAERIALNFLQHLSGIATLTNKYVKKISKYKTIILDTRKTLPGWRYLEKYAVKKGEGGNHRKNLSELILVKDNHINACGGISQALAKVFDEKSAKIKVEVEAENLEQVKECINFPVDIIMLDNMDISTLKKAIKLINSKCKIEVSGGVNLENIEKIAQCEVDYISIGKLTSSAPGLDIHIEL